MTPWSRAVLVGIVTTTGQLLVSGVVLWLLQWALAPTWLVGSANGLGTLLQVIPATIIALYVLILGSVFVIAEQATSTYSGRAMPLVMMEPGISRQLLRALVLAVAALLLSGQIPDQGPPAEAVTAAAATIALATATLIPLSALVLARLVAIHTDPHAFKRSLVLGQFGSEPAAAGEAMLRLRVRILVDMVANGLARKDAECLDAGLTGLVDVERACLSPDDASTPPEADQGESAIGRELAEAWRRITRDLGEPDTPAWLRRRAEAVLHGAAERALDASGDLGAAKVVERAVQLVLSIGDEDSAARLAGLEARAEGAELPSATATALAGWALVVAPDGAGGDRLGEVPPFARSAALIQSYRLSDDRGRARAAVDLLREQEQLGGPRRGRVR